MELEKILCTDSKVEAVKKINAIIEKGGGSGQYIGQIIPSLDPLIEDTLHLLDGALLYVGGMYDQFIKDYIANLFTKYPQRFCTEEEWQNSVATYGVCGKYVYNEGVSVRLPKVGNYLHSTKISNTAPVKGNGKSLGLTDGTNLFGIAQGTLGGSAAYGLSQGSSAYGANVGAVADQTKAGSQNRAVGVTTDQTKSGLIADLSNITSPLEGYYYVVVATGSKTDIEVDIDNIATDLNGKADTDLTNVTNQAKELASLWAFPSKKYIDLELGASGSSYTFPANGYLYLNKGAFGGFQYVNIFINGDGDNNNERQYCKAIHDSNTGFGTVLTFVVPVKKGDIVTIKYTATGATHYFKFFYAIGSESEAE